MGFIIRWALRFIPSSYTWAAVGLIAAAIAAGSFWQGYRMASNAAKSEQLKAVERAIAQADEISAENAEIERNHVQVQTEIRTVYRTIKQEVIKYVETHPDTAECGLDDDGLRLWNKANQGSISAPPG